MPELRRVLVPARDRLCHGNQDSIYRARPLNQQTEHDRDQHTTK